MYDMPASCQCLFVRHMDASYVQAVYRHAMDNALTETCLCILIREPQLRVHLSSLILQVRFRGSMTPTHHALLSLLDEDSPLDVGIGQQQETAETRPTSKACMT